MNASFQAIVDLALASGVYPSELTRPWTARFSKDWYVILNCSLRTRCIPKAPGQLEDLSAAVYWQKLLVGIARPTGASFKKHPKDFAAEFLQAIAQATQQARRCASTAKRVEKAS